MTTCTSEAGGKHYGTLIDLSYAFTVDGKVPWAAILFYLITRVLNILNAYEYDNPLNSLKIFE